MKTTHIPTKIELAMLAAFVDGEGYIGSYTSLVKGKTRTYVRLIICNTDPRLMEWLKQKFGGSVGKHEPVAAKIGKWSTQYQWTVGNERAKELLRFCLPFFVMKRDQAEVAIALQNLCRYGSGWDTIKFDKERSDLRDKLSLLKGKASRRKDLIPQTLHRESEAIN